MKLYDKILFVSHSDISRGPMAEAILQNKLLLEDILVESRGMVVLFPEPVNPKAREILAQHKLDVSEHEAKQLSEDDFDERTLILTMSDAQRHKILEDYKTKAMNVHNLTEYCGYEETEVFNPLGKDLAEYGHCYDVLETITTKLVTILKQEEEEHDSSSV